MSWMISFGIPKKIYKSNISQIISELENELGSLGGEKILCEDTLDFDIYQFEFDFETIVDRAIDIIKNTLNKSNIEVTAEDEDESFDKAYLIAYEYSADEISDEDEDGFED